MTNKYHLKSITAINHTTEKRAYLEFVDRPMIIHGPTNRGKTQMVECILKALIGEKKNSEDKKGNNLISSVNLLDSSKEKELIYESNKTSTLVKDILGKTDISLINSEDGELKPLKASALLSLMILDETRMFSLDMPSFIKAKNMKDTFIKALVFFLYENNDYHNLSKKKTPTKSELEIAIKAISNDIKKNQTELNSLDAGEDIPILDLINTDPEEINEKIAEIEDQILAFIEQHKNLLTRKADLENAIRNSQILISNQKKLMEQYCADINRLELIAEGHRFTKHTDKNHSICPLCGTTIAPASSNINNKVLELELKNILDKASILESQEKHLESDLSDLKNELAKTISNIKVTTMNIKKQSFPKRKLNDMLLALSNKIENRSRIQILKNRLNQDKDDLREKTKLLDSLSEESEITLLPFPKNFVKDINNTIKNILTEAKFPYAEMASFDESQFGIKINGMDKIGSGWNAYFKSVLFLALRMSINNKGIYYLPFLILDSPFLGLSNEVEQEIEMKKGLLSFLENHSSELGQVIIIEKTQNLPNLAPFTQIKPIHFGDDSTAVRYGFFEDNTSSLI